MKTYNCKIKMQSYYADKDAKSLILMICQPLKSNGIGFRYQYDVKFNLRKSEFNQIKFTVPICKNNRQLNTEIVYFKMYDNKKITDHMMRIPLSCGEKL